MSGLGKPAGGRFEALFCFLALSAFLGAYATIPLRMQGGTDLQGGESNPFNAAANAIILVAMVGLVAVNWREYLAVVRVGGPVNLFTALAVLSTFWSYDPAVTLRRSLSLLQMVLYAYYLIARFPVERVLRILAAVYAVALVLSAVLALGMPDVGIMHEAELTGTWCGVFEHKSGLGIACTLGVLCFGWQWVREPKRRYRYAAGILLGLMLAVMSQSKTAQLTIALLLPVAAYLRLIRRPGLRRVWAVFIAVAVLLAGAAVLFFNFADLTSAVGKDATLTGRIPVWTSLLEFAMTRPLGGYGYTAFFVLSNPEVENVWRQGGWKMWDAHNTIIGTLLELGIPGLVLSAWVLAAVVRNSLRVLSEDAASWAGFAAIYVISFAPIGLVEMILFRGDINSVLLPMFYVALRQRMATTQAAQAGSAVPTRGAIRATRGVRAGGVAGWPGGARNAPRLLQR